MFKLFTAFSLGVILAFIFCYFSFFVQAIEGQKTIAEMNGKVQIMQEVCPRIVQSVMPKKDKKR